MSDVIEASNWVRLEIANGVVFLDGKVVGGIDPAQPGGFHEVARTEDDPKPDHIISKE